MAIARYEPNGELDPTFGANGVVTDPVAGQYAAATSIALDTAGRVVAAGFADQKVAVARYRADGSVDRTFGANGSTTVGSGGLDEAEDTACSPTAASWSPAWAPTRSQSCGLERMAGSISLSGTMGSPGRRSESSPARVPSRSSRTGRSSQRATCPMRARRTSSLARYRGHLANGDPCRARCRAVRETHHSRRERHSGRARCERRALGERLLRGLRTTIERHYAADGRELERPRHTAEPDGLPKPDRG